MNSSLITVQRLLLILLLGQRCSSDQSDQVQRYRLPTEIKPTRYELTLRLEEDFFDTKIFCGQVKIEFVTEKQDQKNIILNSDRLKFSEPALIIDKKTGDKIHILMEVTVKESHRVMYTLKVPLTPNVTYELGIRYCGNFRDDMDGFYLTSYMQDYNVQWLALMHMEPINARQVFPCFDEPDFKAVFSITTIYPRQYHAISNHPPMNPDTVDPDNPKLTVRTFMPTPRLSPHLVGLVISTLESNSITSNKVVHTFFYQSDLRGGEDTVLLQTPPALEALMQLLGHSSTAKVTKTSIHDMKGVNYIAVPNGSTTLGTWGLTVYREDQILWNKYQSTTRSKQTAFIMLVTQLSGIWFGNLRTCKWWNSLWVDDSFNALLPYYVIDEKTWRMQRQFIVNELQVAMEADSFPSVEKISSIPEDVLTPAQIIKKFNPRFSRKGACLIQMMHHFLGHDLFFRGLRTYMSPTYLSLFNNVESDDLWKAWTHNKGLQRKLPPDTTLSEVMNSWTDNPGLPIVFVKKVDSKIILRADRFIIYKGNITNDRWFIPVTYAICKTLDYQEVQTNSSLWITPGAQLVLDVNLDEENDWIVVNLLSAGFYVVNYDKELWYRIHAALLRNHTQIHVRNRAQIINDIFSLARAGLVSYHRVLKILSYLSLETEYTPWKTVFRGLDFLRSRIYYDRKVRELLDTFIAEIMENILKLVSTDLNTKHHEHILRNELIMSWACKLGKTECVDYSKSHFNKFIDYNQRVPPDQKSYIFCAGISFLDMKRDWDTMYSRLKEIKQPSEIQVIIEALACSPRRSFLKRYLEDSIKPKSGVSNHDFHRIFKAVTTTTSRGASVGLDFFIKNFDKIVTKYTIFTDLIEAVDVLADSLTMIAQIKKFKKFVEIADLNELREVAYLAVERCEATLFWKDMRKYKLSSALKLKVSFKSSASTIRASLLLFIAITCSDKRTQLLQVCCV